MFVFNSKQQPSGLYAFLSFFFFLKKKNQFVSEDGRNNSAESRWAVIRLWFAGAVLEVECDNANGIEECLRL